MNVPRVNRIPGVTLLIALIATAVATAGAMTGTRGPNLAKVKSDLHAGILAALAVPMDPSNLQFGG